MSRYKKTDLNKIDKKYLLLLNKKNQTGYYIRSLYAIRSNALRQYIENLRKTKIYTKEKTLYLEMMEKDNLLGDSVEKRFNHLGNLMNLNLKLILCKNFLVVYEFSYLRKKLILLIKGLTCIYLNTSYPF